ncbi:MAG TPA: ABC transporter permease [bacterium]|nr:ABC transporter permease [bacterium]HPS30761.1 ABC transporter permease [bacterium]
MSEFIRFIATRYLIKGRKKGAISLISLISVSGLALGVAALITVLSVMDGFLIQMKKTVLNSTSHANIYKLLGDFDNYDEMSEKISKINGIKGISPVVFNEVLISSGREITGALLNGVDSKTYYKVANIPEMMIKGNFGCLDPEKLCSGRNNKTEHEKNVDDFLGEKDSSIPPVIIGSGIASKLKADIGSVITVVGSKGKKTRTEESAPVSRNFKVAGIFDTGLYDYDSRYLYAGITDVQNFLEIGRNTSFLSIRVENIDQIKDITEMVMNETGGFPYAVQDWEEMHKTTFRFLELQKIVMFVILIFIILVASFGIITTLIMLVISKTREVSVLRALGVKRSTIAGIFMFDGFIIGLAGTVLGALLAVAACLILKQINFPLSKEIYFFSTLPVEMSVFSFLSVSLSSLLISVIATLYPCIKASGITPVEGLRYE